VYRLNLESRAKTNKTVITAGRDFHPALKVLFNLNPVYPIQGIITRFIGKTFMGIVNPIVNPNRQSPTISSERDMLAVRAKKMMEMTLNQIQGGPRSRAFWLLKISTRR
jgi:hypothetical protein